MKDTRTDQLRVRLRREERQQLEQHVQNRGKNETISDVIREALNWCINPDQSLHPVYVSKETAAIVAALADELKRDPGEVVKDCVNGILALVEKRKPLIVQEIRLRRKYQAQK